MKKFVIRLLQFSLIPLVLSVGLLFLPFNREQACLTIKNDCYDRSMWIYEQLFHHPVQADLVFFGTSRTTAAVNDTCIEQQLNEHGTGKLTKVVNLGYCRYGQNLQYVFIKELLKHHVPKVVILEIRRDPDQPCHLHFPYFADGKDLLSTRAFFHHNYADDLMTGMYYRLKNFNGSQANAEYTRRTCGFEGIPFLLPFDTSDTYYRPEHGEPDINLAFFQKSMDLLQQHHVKIIFLYIPQYGRYQHTPNHLDWYQRYGKVLVPPDTLSNTVCFWANHDHMSLDGAAWFSDWLSRQLVLAQEGR